MILNLLKHKITKVIPKKTAPTEGVKSLKNKSRKTVKAKEVKT